MTSKPRIVYLDIIRVLACLSVATVHFNASFSQWTNGTFVFPNSVFPNMLFNHGIYLGSFGVSLFFMISGAGFQVAYPCGCKPIKKYYEKRFLAIYPMYWIALFAATVFSVLRLKCMSDASKWMLIPSLLGLDGYLGSLGITGYGFYQIGEWFLGCIIIMYLFVPLLLWGCREHPVFACCVSLAIYVALSGRCSQFMFLLRIPEMLFGMLFAKYYRPLDKQRAWKTAFLPFSLIFALCVLCDYIPLRDTLHYLMMICALVVWFVALISVYIPHWLSAPFTAFARYTYPVFLTHHMISNCLAQGFALDSLPKRTLLVCYSAFWVITVSMSYFLQAVNTRAITYIKGYIGRIKEEQKGASI